MIGANDMTIGELKDLIASKGVSRHLLADTESPDKLLRIWAAETLVEKSPPPGLTDEGLDAWHVSAEARYENWMKANINKVNDELGLTKKGAKIRRVKLSKLSADDNQAMFLNGVGDDLENVVDTKSAAARQELFEKMTPDARAKFWQHMNDKTRAEGRKLADLELRKANIDSTNVIADPIEAVLGRGAMDVGWDQADLAQRRAIQEQLSPMVTPPPTRVPGGADVPTAPAFAGLGDELTERGEQAIGELGRAERGVAQLGRADAAQASARREVIEQELPMPE